MRCFSASKTLNYKVKAGPGITAASLSAALFSQQQVGLWHHLHLIILFSAMHIPQYL